MSTPPRRSWLEGPPRLTDDYPGQRLGMPPEGRGSVATMGERLGALLLDLVVSAVIGLLIVRPTHVSQENRWNLWSDAIFILLTAILLASSGRTLGMRALGLQVVRLDGRRMGLRSLPRQILLGLFFPALVVDRDKRGLQDKACGTAVVRVR